MAGSLSTGNIFVDTTDLKKLARDLRATSPALYAEFRVQMKAVGQLVADDAKRRAGYSKQIPASIKPSVTASGTAVRVTASAPNAAPIENKGKGYVRHRVYGQDVWTDKNSHPAFLAPAVDAHDTEIVETVADAVSNAFKITGWR